MNQIPTITGLSGSSTSSTDNAVEEWSAERKLYRWKTLNELSAVVNCCYCAKLGPRNIPGREKGTKTVSCSASGHPSRYRSHLDLYDVLGPSCTSLASRQPRC